MIKKIFIAGVACAVILVLWAFWLEPGRPARIQNEELALETWPAELSGLKVAVLADLHVGSPFNGLERLKKTIERVNAEKPDLILIAGDLMIQGVVGGRQVAPADMAPALKELKAELGVFAVLGNHDNWYGGKAVAAALEGAGITVLSNQERRLRFKESEFWLIGVEDLWTGHPDFEGPLARAVNGPVLLFTHNPDLFVDVPERVSLTVAGHTHGGQVSIPFYGPPVVPSRYGRRFAAGHIVEGGRHLFVSQGVGTSILPVRFRVPPEISLLILNPAPR